MSITKTDSDLYRRMADDYRQALKTQPFVDHAILAIKVGARTLNIPVERLQAPTLSKKRQDLGIVETRQRLMAFSRVISESSDRPNSLKRIGRAFRRHHTTVLHAIEKFGDEIASAIK